MGAWGAASFENDTALDFASEIQTLADVESAFVAEGAEEIDADTASRVIVAAESVAAMRGHRSPGMPDDLAAKVDRFGKCSIGLYDTARNNLSAVMSRGELLELWVEEGSGEWNRAVTDLLERLNKPAVKRKKPAKRKKKPQSNPSACMFCDKPMGEGAFHMIDITVNDDEISAMKMGGWVHLQCLNAALHPRHMMQTWDFDDELLDHFLKKRDAERDAE
ncbi:DUF4259 domain-containing protein [Erythrobacter alti]|uniref:DUF4259 domain-containing protein n=1 Tax=Erythrobacter alti TaxID=1896145 RepID=UPI0030F4AA3E